MLPSCFIVCLPSFITIVEAIDFFHPWSSFFYCGSFAIHTRFLIYDVRLYSPTTQPGRVLWQKQLCIKEPGWICQLLQPNLSTSPGSTISQFHPFLEWYKVLVGFHPQKYLGVSSDKHFLMQRINVDKCIEVKRQFKASSKCQLGS